MSGRIQMISYVAIQKDSDRDYYFCLVVASRAQPRPNVLTLRLSMRLKIVHNLRIINF